MNTNKPSKAQHGAINALLHKMGIQDQKEELVYLFTNKRSKSRADLFSSEANELIAYLKKIDPDEKAAEAMRRKIIAMAHEMGWELPGTKKADMVHIDNWCQKSSYLHKKLNQYLYKELPALVSQFELVHKSFLNSI